MGSWPLLYVKPLGVNFTKFGLPPRSPSGALMPVKPTPGLGFKHTTIKKIALIGHSSS